MEDIIKIKFVDSTGKISARLESVVSSRMESAAKRLEKKVKKKFSKSSMFGNPSKPGQYPRSLNGHAVNSIKVFKTAHASGDKIQVGFASGSKRYSQRINMLSKDTTITPKGKALAIPLTLAAKRYSSDVRNSKKSLHSFRPGGKEMEWIKGKDGDSFLAVKSGVVSRVFGQKYVRHFLLTKRTVHRKARKGLSDAMKEEETWFVNYLTDGVKSQFGAP